MPYLSKLKLYASFILVSVLTAFIISILSVAISGSRGAAGIGLFLGPLFGHLLVSYRLIDLSIIIKIILAIVITAIVTTATIAIIEYGGVKLGLDYYGYLDFLVIYLTLSVLCWELTRYVASKFSRPGH